MGTISSSISPKMLCQRINFFDDSRSRVRINAELRCGEILKKREKAPSVPKGATRAGGKVLTRSGDRTPLEDLGITKNQSADWQRMAKDPVEPANRQSVRIAAGKRGVAQWSLKYKHLLEIRAIAVSSPGLADFWIG